MEATLRKGVDPCRRHGQERRGAGEDGEDGRSDLHRLSESGQVSHLAGAVDPIGLGHPNQVQSRLLHLCNLSGRGPEPTGVAEHRADLHRLPHSVRQWIPVANTRGRRGSRTRLSGAMPQVTAGERDLRPMGGDHPAVIA